MFINQSLKFQIIKCECLSKLFNYTDARIEGVIIRRIPRKKDGEIGRRSFFNDNKTRLYRPRLYEILGSEPNISFRYSTKPEADRSDKDIISCMPEKQE